MVATELTPRERGLLTALRNLLWATEDRALLSSASWAEFQDRARSAVAAAEGR